MAAGAATGRTRSWYAVSTPFKAAGADQVARTLVAVMVLKVGPAKPSGAACTVRNAVFVGLVAAPAPLLART
jgi:hypothetical protein